MSRLHDAGGAGSAGALSAGALLTIDLDAIAANWRLLQARAGAARCAAVLKADAYGLGAARVGPALAAAGCREFFVAHLDEALALKPWLPPDARLSVLHGPMPGTEPEFVAHGLRPVLNSRAQIEAWRALARQQDRELDAIVQVDTGMARLGLPPEELQALAQDPQAWQGLQISLVMSHLACADEPAHPANAAQLRRFLLARRLLPAAPASLANSSGIFLGADFHFDLVRPGAALYGIAPTAGEPNPLHPVLRLEARVIQVRQVEPGTAVGYGASWLAPRPTRVATVAVGYADGWLRSGSSRGAAHWGDLPLPVIGRVSMDTLTLDASALPEGALQPGDPVSLIGEHTSVDDVAAAAGTIGYEVLTRLGGRFLRRYVGGG